jgi:lipoprotein-anchoring transpeptidase ErfK/SrfK
VLLFLLLGAFAFDQSRGDTIANGVSIGGVDVSGLSSAQARAKLDEQLQQPLLKPVKVSYEGKARKLTAQDAGVTVDLDGMVNEAIDRSNSGFFVKTAVLGVAGVNRNVSIPTRVDYSEAKIKKFVAKMRAVYNRKPIDAHIDYSAKSIGEVDGRPGLSVKSAKLANALIATFQNPEASRRIKLPVKKKAAKVTRSELASKFGTIILVDRSGFKLRLFKRLKLFKTYGIAVGRAGLETPQGLYSINDKQTNPAWHVPNSAWAGKLAGKTIPPGDPGNPIKARWLGIYDGVGIHGTSEPSSIGSAASHGCIRMIPAQVIDLFDRVPMGTPVYIG